jgi:DNA-binding MarR family transcriptional regulator
MELSPAVKEAYISFFLSYAAVTRKIDVRMQAAGVLSIDDYDVLLALEEAPGQQMRMSDLADAIVRSKSGLTRKIDRMEKDGLVARKACMNDRRALFAVLTPQGLAERVRSWPVYRQAIAEEFGVHMADDEAVMLARVLNRMLAGHPHAGRGRS